MAEQIGLEGKFDLKGWDAGISRYQSSLNKTISQTNKAADSFGKSWNQMGANVAKITATMGVALVAAGAAAGLAIGKFTADGISKAANLEEQLSAIAATLNMTAEQVAPLNDLILQLGLDPDLKVNAQEAADAIENLARNGLSMTEIVDGAARSTVLLANATGADFGLAADIATDTMALFNIEAANMDEAINGITGVTNASKFTIDDYRLALSQAGGVAAASGVSFDDFNATITAISPAFASGSDAGTSFKTMLQRLIPQSTEAADMMMELGLMTEDGSNKFFDANGNMRDMNEIAVLLNGALAGLTEEQKLNAVTVLAGADASRAMLGLMEAGAVAYTDAEVAAKALGVTQEEVNAVIEGGVTQFEALALQLGSIDAAEQAKTRMDNFKGSMEILQGAIETLQIRIGQAFLPVLKDLADWASGWVATHGPAIAAAFESFATNVSALIQYLRIVVTDGDLMNDWLTHMSPTLAGVVLGVGALAGAISTALGAALTFIQQHMDAFKGALIGIGVVLAAATITAGITAIAGAIATLFTPIGLVIVAAGLLGAAWNTNFLGMRDATIAAVGAIQEAFAPLTTAIQTFGAGALTEIQAFVTGNQTEFTNLQAIWTGAQEAFGNVGTLIQEAAATFIGYLREQFPQLTPVFDGFSAAVALVFSQVGAQFTLLQDSVSALVSLVTALINGDWALAWQSAQVLVGAFVTYVTTTFASISEIFTTTFGAISPVVTGALTEIQNFVTGNETEFTNLNALWTGAKTTFDTAFNGISEWFASKWPGIKATLEEWGIDFDLLSESVGVLKEAFETAFNAIGPVVAGAFTEIQAFVTGNETEFTNLNTIWEGAKTVFDTVFDGISEWFTTNWPDIQSTLEEWGVDFGLISDAIGVLQEAWDAFADAFETAISAVETTWQALVDVFGPSIDGLIESFGAFTTDVQGLGDSFSALMDALGLLGTAFSEVWDIISPILEQIAIGIGAALGVVAIFAINLLGSTFENLGAIIETVINQATLIINTVAETITTMVDLVTALVNGDWKTAWDEFKNLVNIGIGLVTGSIDNLMILVGTIGATIYDAIVGTLEDLGLPGVKEKAANIWRGIVDSAETVFGIDLSGATPSSVFTVLGNAVIQGMINGFWEKIEAVRLKLAEIKAEIIRYWATFSWGDLGTSIVDGIGAGIIAAKDNLLKKIEELAGFIPQWARDALGISSPAKVMIPIGKEIVNGLIVGMQSREHELLRAMQSIADGITKIAERAGRDAMKVYTGALTGFASVGGAMPDFFTEANLNDPRLSKILDVFQNRAITTDFLKQQAALIESIRNAGGDPSEVLAGLTLGPDADALTMLQIVDRTMAHLNAGLTESIRAAVSGIDKAIEQLRSGRKTIEEIEERFTDRHLSILDGYKSELAKIDEEIAALEQEALATGDRSKLARIQRLNLDRTALLNQAEAFLTAQRDLSQAVERMRENRDAIGDIEQDFSTDTISTLNRHKNELTELDAEIAELEARMVETGDRSILSRIQTLDDRRDRMVARIEDILRQRNELAELLTEMPASTNEQAQNALKDFQKRFIDPMVAAFETASISQRANILASIQNQQQLMRRFAASIPTIVAAEEQALAAAEGFGDEVQDRVQEMLGNLYNPAMINRQPAILENLRQFAVRLNSIRNEIEQRSAQRETGQSIIEQLTAGPKDLLATFQATIEGIDRQIETAQNQALETGNALHLQNIRLLDTQRDAAEARLRDLLNLRRNRQSIEDVEERFTGRHLSALERYASDLEGIDQRIADAERLAMTGNTGALSTISQLDNQRRVMLAQVEKFFSQRRLMEQIIARQPRSDSERAQATIDRWRATMIDPLLATFDDQSSSARETFLNLAQQRMTILQVFAQNIGRISSAENLATRALEGFGEGARARVGTILNLLYDPAQTANLQSNLNALAAFTTTLNNIRNTIEQAQGRRLSTDTMIERLMGGFDQMQRFRNAIDDIDAQIARSQERALEFGDFGELANIRALDNTRLQRQADLEQFVQQSEQLASIMKHVKNLSGPGQAAAERFLQESIQPIVDAFNMPMRAVDRQAWLNTATERVTMLNRFVDQMRDVERLQARIAGNKAFDHLADEFAMLQDILIPAATRSSLINQLNSYITQMSRLHEIQQDITVGRGINPLVERFASQRLDAIARQLEDINMSEMQRAQLIEQYRVEQEKILALQQKQQQLQFLQEQLGLVQMLESLNDEFDDIVSLENIFQGITLGINASMDDMLLLTSRAMDALLATVMQQLGIASPSRVMAGFGRNLMQGLSMGIQAAADVPLRAIRSAAGNLIPYSLTHRSLAMNMGGVTINNMMDDVMFESRIRQIIRSEFGS